MKRGQRGGFAVLGLLVAAAAFLLINPDTLIKYLLFLTIFVVLEGSVILLAVFFDGASDKEEYYVKEELQGAAKRRLEGLSGSFSRLAASLSCLKESKPALDINDMDHVFEELSKNLCSGCTNCNSCWDQRFEESYESVCYLMQMAQTNGAVKEEDVPVNFMQQCICVDDFLKETNRNLSLEKMKLAWHNRIEESREAVAGQLNEVSRIVNEFSGSLCDANDIVEMRKRKINTKFSKHKVKVRHIMMFERSNQGMELHLTARCKSGHCITTKEAASILGNAVGKRFIPRGDSKNVIGRDYADYVFCEDVNFKVLTGVARVSKVKGDISGDNFSFLYPESNDMVMMLSDGMGTGETACEESKMVIELLEQLLEAGFREESAVKLINSVLVLKSEQTMFSTMDLCMINLCAGTCQFVKVGAATTFIKRDGCVETISSTTLPAGMLNNVDYETKSKKLYHGDYVIMISDGVLDCVKEDDKEGFLQRAIIGIKSKNPQEVANSILAAALEQQSFQPIDDMTVLVTGIWKK